MRYSLWSYEREREKDTCTWFHSSTLVCRSTAGNRSVLLLEWYHRGTRA